MTSLLETKDLAKSFGAVTAAADINVKINPGEIVGVIGSNGAGKTTFINMVTGFLEPSSGEILFEGESVLGKKPRQVMRAGMCRSFQIAQLFPELTTLENILIADSMAKNEKLPFFQSIHTKVNENNAMETLREYGIAQYSNDVVATIPQGVRKLLDIAIAMLSKPKILLLDEPTSGVAIEDKFDLMNTVMAAVKRSKAAVLFVEHDMDVIARYSTRLIAFYDGRVLADGPTAEVIHNEDVQKLVIGHHLDIDELEEAANA